jgi:myo-inositol catabolism protein IolH
MTEPHSQRRRQRPSPRGRRAATLIPEVGSRLGAVYAADTFDHRRSHNLRYITNPPGTPARVHQHLKIGDGDVDVDWAQLFAALHAAGFLDRQDALIVSNVFAEDETADETSRCQLRKISELIDGAAGA